MLVVVDNCGVPARVTDEVAARLKASAGLSRGSWSARRTPTAVPPWVAPSPSSSAPRSRSTRRSGSTATRPVLRATDPDGKVWAVLAGYVCHCTTLGGEFNKICGDWAGYFCEAIERDPPGAVALVVIGCGADANPEPRRGLEVVVDYALRLRRECAADRLWVVAYSNDVPCHIAPRRVLSEGATRPTPR